MSFGPLTEPTLSLTDQPADMCGYNPDPHGRVFAYMLAASPELVDCEEEGEDDGYSLHRMQGFLKEQGADRFVEADLEERLHAMVYDGGMWDDDDENI